MKATAHHDEGHVSITFDNVFLTATVYPEKTGAGFSTLHIQSRADALCLMAAVSRALSYFDIDTEGVTRQEREALATDIERGRDRLTIEGAKGLIGAASPSSAGAPPPMGGREGAGSTGEVTP